MLRLLFVILISFSVCSCAQNIERRENGGSLDAGSVAIELDAVLILSVLIREYERVNSSLPHNLDEIYENLKARGKQYKLTTADVSNIVLIKHRNGVWEISWDQAHLESCVIHFYAKCAPIRFLPVNDAKMEVELEQIKPVLKTVHFTVEKRVRSDGGVDWLTNNSICSSSNPAREYHYPLQKCYLLAMKELDSAKTNQERFYALADAAKESFNCNNIEDARKYAQELLELSLQFKQDWNYGNAIHDGNMVLGRIALLDGKLKDAKQFLLMAAKTPGSPQIKTYGPNLSLAKDLLEKGEREIVLKYINLCCDKWLYGSWEKAKLLEDLKNGETPTFGPNLFY